MKFASNLFDLIVNDILTLIKKINIYMSMDNPNQSLVRNMMEWLEMILDILGFVYSEKKVDMEMESWMEMIVNERNKIRGLTRDKDISKDVKKKLFDILDEQRNIVLPKFGIVIQDTKDNSLWFKK